MKTRESLLSNTKEDVILTYELFKNDNKIEFYICESKRSLDVYMINNKDGKVVKLNIKGGEYVVEQYLFSINNYCMYNWFPQESKNKKEYFKCDYKINNWVYVFDIKSNKSTYNPFYECLNFIISHSKLGDLYKVRPKYKSTSIITRAKALDDEIIAFVEKYATGRPYSFERKLNEEWKKTNYTKRCKNFCRRLDNEQLIEVILNTQYLNMVGDCLKYIKPLDIDMLVYERKVSKIQIFFYLNSFIRYIKSLELTEDYENEIFKNSEVYEQMRYMVSIMDEEEKMFIFNCNIDWEGKINFINLFPIDIKQK